MTSVANHLGISRASISKNSVAFVETDDLPNSKYLKDEEVRTAYADAQLDSIRRNRTKPFKPMPELPL
jgi:hypothetical protein